MKKFYVVCFLAVFLVFPVAAISVDNAIKIFNDTCKKYEWAHLTKNIQTSDDRSEKVDLARKKYPGGEIFILTIIKGGNRYEIKVDFLDKSEPNSVRITDVKKSVLNTMQAILPKDMQQEASTEQ
jgi:hypothetical protein